MNNSITYLQACISDSPGVNDITICAFIKEEDALNFFNNLFKDVEGFDKNNPYILLNRYDYDKYNHIFNILFKNFKPEEPLILYDYDIAFFLTTEKEGQPLLEDILK
jgi:hypothetical protein